MCASNATCTATPGYTPLATDSRDEWVGTMQRVSRGLMKTHGGSAVAPEMAVSALVNSGRFCDSCHGGGLYKLNALVTHNLEASGFDP
jgi:hypothetical protein